MRCWVVIVALALAGCDVAPPPVSPPPGPGLTADEAARSFIEVLRTVEPVAERECRRLAAPDTNCDFLIRVDRDLRAAPNAYQSLGPDGQPVITFTVGLIATANSADEMAFVLGHEAAHHIAGHLARQASNAATGAAIMAGLATMTGASAADVDSAERLGAAVGARSYSKEFELEADRLGTLIVTRAGYDPVLGAGYFTRIPDPGDRFLGTHPPNAERMQAVRDTAARIGAGG
jgi:Zn-dependent protease with chaperone function